MRKQKLLSYELGKMIEQRNKPNTAFSYREERMIFKCSRILEIPKYVTLLEKDERVKREEEILALMKEEVEVEKNEPEYAQNYQEIKVQPNRKDLQTQKENWRHIIQERYKKRKVIPYQEVEDYLVDVYNQKAIELERAKEQNPMEEILQYTESKGEATNKFTRSEEQIQPKAKARIKKLQAVLESLLDTKEPSNEVQVKFVRPAVEPQAPKPSPLRLNKLKLQKLRKIQKLREKQEFVLQNQDDEVTVAVTTERNRITDDKVLKYKSFMESGQLFLDYSQLLTGRLQTIELINRENFLSS